MNAEETKHILVTKTDQIERPNFLTRLVHFLDRTPVHALIILISLVWLTPTIGLLVSSFRPASLVASTGWWTAFQPPLHFTLNLYRQALEANGMATSFVNSLFIAIPATIIPILIAAFAALIAIVLIFAFIFKEAIPIFTDDEIKAEASIDKMTFNADGTIAPV